MSEENLDLVRSIVASWERGAFTSTEWAHPEIDFVIVDGPAPGRWIGPAGMAKGWGDFMSVWDEGHSQTDELRELDDERVLGLGRFIGRGRASGLEVANWEGASVFHVCDGTVTRLVVYFDRARALADLGLAAQTKERE